MIKQDWWGALDLARLDTSLNPAPRQSFRAIAGGTARISGAIRDDKSILARPHLLTTMDFTSLKDSFNETVKIS